MMPTNHDLPEVPLAWARQDIEQRLFFPGGRHTCVNTIVAMLLGVVLSGLFYGALQVLIGGSAAEMFTQRGLIPYAIVFFSFWSLAIILLKSRKLSFQKQALLHHVVPEDPDFILSASNVNVIEDRIYQIVDDPKYFVLYNRIIVALANLRNLGRIGDVDEILRSQADNDEATAETSYSLIVGFVWAIPVLGFIGTVIGLSQAIGRFDIVLEQASNIDGIKSGLTGVTGGLSIAFVTTLQALVAALVIQLLLTFLKKSEQEFLDECSRYCTNQIVNRLRIMPFERVREED